MAYSLGHPEDPLTTYVAVAKAVQTLKEHTPDADVMDVVIYDDGSQSHHNAPEANVAAVGLTFSTEENLDYDDIVLSDDGIDKAEALEEISYGSN